MSAFFFFKIVAFDEILSFSVLRLMSVIIEETVN
jgi:hypothetical protein